MEKHKERASRAAAIAQSVAHLLIVPKSSALWAHLFGFPGPRDTFPGLHGKNIVILIKYSRIMPKSLKYIISLEYIIYHGYMYDYI